MYTNSCPCYHVKLFSGAGFAVTFITCMLWGLVLQFMAGYFFLHSWHNLFGEVLCFADREFYSVSCYDVPVFIVHLATDHGYR